MRSPFVEVLAAIRRAMEELHAGWYLFGAQAALVHGAARLTVDVDVTVLLDGPGTPELVAALERAGFEARVRDDAFFQRTRVVPVLHRATGVTADVVLGGPGLEQEFLRRAEVRDLGGVQVPVACAEDILIMKVLSGRAKDVDDVVAILAAHPSGLDLDRVRGTLGILEQALGQSDLLPLFEAALGRSRRT